MPKRARLWKESRDMFNYSNKRVGGIRFIRLGRFQLSFCVMRADRYAIRQLGLRAVALA